jgi:mono/diheme cytochrome c family protein
MHPAQTQGRAQPRLTCRKRWDWMRRVPKIVVAVALAILFCAPAHAADVASGKELYEARCSFCHGTEGKGDGPAGSALQPRPTNFADAAYRQHASAEMQRIVILNGKPGTAMVPFGQTLRPAEIDDLIAYLQTFR